MSLLYICLAVWETWLPLKTAGVQTLSGGTHKGQVALC